MPTVRVVVDKHGGVTAIHNDKLQRILNAAGTATIRRVSHVDVAADLRPEAIDWLWSIGINPALNPNAHWVHFLIGPMRVAGPFDTLAEALAFEVECVQEMLENQIKESNHDRV